MNANLLEAAIILKLDNHFSRTFTLSDALVDEKTFDSYKYIIIDGKYTSIKFHIQEFHRLLVNERSTLAMTMLNDLIDKIKYEIGDPLLRALEQIKEEIYTERQSDTI